MGEVVVRNLYLESEDAVLDKRQYFWMAAVLLHV